MVISHDFHIHTNLSLCAKPEATLELYKRKGEELGLKKMAITNHLWDHAIPDWTNDENTEFYEVQDVKHISQIKKEMEAFNKDGAGFLFGAEAEYSYKHSRPAISPEVAEQMDVLLVPNSHTHITMPKTFYEPHRKHIEFMIDAFMNIVNSDVSRYITAIPHPFMAVCCPYDNHLLLNEITDDEFKMCFNAAANKGIALELNPNFLKNRTMEQMYNDSIIRMYKIGKQEGCKFTVGTDSHSESGYDAFSLIYVLTSVLDLKDDDFHPLTK